MNKLRKAAGVDREEFRRKVRREWSPFIVLILVIFFGICILFADSEVEAKEVMVGESYPNEIQSLFLEPQKQKPEKVEVIQPSLSQVFTPEVLNWSEKIISWADEYGLEANLVATVMQIESCGNPQVISRSGAIGLFQVMPYHFVPGEDPFDPDTNALRGLKYLRESFKLSGGDIRNTLAGYNGGHGVIPLPRNSWKEETKRYAKWGKRIYLDVQAGLDKSPTLEGWYEKYGSGLCKEAATVLGMR